jgi:hypothetical protein
LKGNDIVNPINTVWTLVAAFLVFGMQVGFTMLETSFFRSFGTREKLPGFAHQKLPTKAGGGEPTYGMYHIDPAVSCPRARPVLQVGHSIRAQVGNFS